MSSVNLFYKLIGILSNGSYISAGSLSNPVTVTAASDAGSDTTYLVPTATVFTLTDDLDASTNIVMILSPTDATLEWNSVALTDSSSIGIKANVPFIMANLVTTDYSAVPSTRTSNAATSAITAIRIYHAAGTTQKVRVLTFD